MLSRCHGHESADIPPRSRHKRLPRAGHLGARVGAPCAGLLLLLVAAMSCKPEPAESPPQLELFGFVPALRIPETVVLTHPAPDTLQTISISIYPADAAPTEGRRYRFERSESHPFFVEDSAGYGLLYLPFNPANTEMTVDISSTGRDGGSSSEHHGLITGYNEELVHLQVVADEQRTESCGDAASIWFLPYNYKFAVAVDDCTQRVVGTYKIGFGEMSSLDQVFGADILTEQRQQRVQIFTGRLQPGSGSTVMSLSPSGETIAENDFVNSNYTHAIANLNQGFIGFRTRLVDDPEEAYSNEIVYVDTRGEEQPLFDLQDLDILSDFTVNSDTGFLYYANSLQCLSNAESSGGEEVLPGSRLWFSSDSVFRCSMTTGEGYVLVFDFDEETLQSSLLFSLYLPEGSAPHSVLCLGDRAETNEPVCYVYARHDGTKGTGEPAAVLRIEAGTCEADGGHCDLSYDDLDMQFIQGSSRIYGKLLTDQEGFLYTVSTDGTLERHQLTSGAGDEFMITLGALTLFTESTEQPFIEIGMGTRFSPREVVPGLQ